MKKIICIILTLTLVLASVSLAFADNGFEPLSSRGWIYGSTYTSYGSALNKDAYTIHYNNSLSNPPCWELYISPYVGMTETNVSVDAVLHISNASVSDILLGNAKYASGGNYAPIITDSRISENEGNTGLYRPFTNATYGNLLQVGDDTRFNIHLDSINNFNGVIAYICTNKSTGVYDFDLTVEYLKIGDSVVIGEDPLAGLTVDTYAFTVPYGSNVKFTAERIDAIYVRYDTGDRKVGSYLGSTIPTAKYSYSGTPNTLSALQSAMSMPLKGYGKRSLLGAYSTFECSLLPNGKQVNVFNPLNPDSDSVAYGDMFVNITTLGAPKAVYYSPNGSVQIINGSSDAVNDEGNSTTIGGSGTSDDPYIQTPTFNDGSTVNLDNISFGDNTNNDGVISNFVAVLQSIFSIPTSIVSNLGQWVGGLGDVITSLFGAMPSQITSMIVTFFSAVLLIGIIKMFL